MGATTIATPSGCSMGPDMAAATMARDVVTMKTAQDGSVMADLGEAAAAKTCRTAGAPPGERAGSTERRENRAGAEGGPMAADTPNLVIYNTMGWG